MDKNIQSWHKSDNSSYNNFDCLVDGRNIRNLLSDKTFLVRDSKRKSYSIYFAIENNILEIDNDDSFLNEPESLFSISKNSSYLKKGSKNNNSNDHYISDIKSNWNNNINSCIENYLRSQICIDSYIFGKVSNSGESKSTSIITSTNDPSASYLESSNDFDFEGEGEGMEKFKHLWISCEDCYGLNYKKYFKSKMNICEHCGSHLKMSSSDRIELLIDPDTWNPMDEYMVSVDPIEFDKVVSVDPVDPFEFDMVSVDPIEFDKVSVDPIEFDKVSLDPVDPIEFDKVSVDPVDPFEFDMEEEPYINRLDSYQKSTGLMEAVQTGTGQLNGIPLAIGIMEFQFMGGSMGSVVGEKITRLIEYATNERLPLILVCASGGARMQEGSLSLMQMAKISSALYDYQINQKLFYVPILTSPTTGGVTASFGMLGDIIIAEPNAYIAFAGKRVIEQTLKKEVPEGSQSAEFLFEKGLFDSIVPRNLLKEVLTELFKFHGFVPLTQNEK